LLKPVVAALATFAWPYRIFVFIPPCPFASGAESRVVEEIPQVNQVIGAQETVRFILRGRLPAKFTPAGKGIVLFLGGDLTYAAFLAKRLRYPAVAYTEGLTNWARSFARFAMAYPWMVDKGKNPAVKKKTAVIGNIMLDAIKPEYSKEEMKRLMGNEQAPGLLLLPGSRPAHFQYMLAFYVKTVEKIKAQMPTLATAVSISPFVTEEQLRAALSGWGAKEWGLSATYHPAGEHTSTTAGSLKVLGEIKTETGVGIPCFHHQQYALMNWADLALTIPGTNTVELAALGVPLLVSIPLNHPEEIPLEGLAGLVGGIPLLGKALKRRLVPKFQAKIKFTAWPNRLAGEQIVPELIGQIFPDEVAEVAIKMLRDESGLAKAGQRLQKVVGEPGAAQRLIDILEEVVGSTYHEGFTR
jgi:lipid-A-disaccharide synthase